MTGSDTALFDLINREWTSPFLDHFLPVFSSFDVWKPVMIATAIGFAIFGRTRGRQFLLCVVIGLLLGDVVISQGLKHLVNRPRPRDVHVGTIVRSLSPDKPRILHVFDPPLVKEAAIAVDPAKRGRSFPSSHVLNVFMLATVAFRFHRIAGVIIGCGGFLVAWSRVYCGSHWPGDLPPSVLLGICVGLAACSIMSLLARRFGWTEEHRVDSLQTSGHPPGSPSSQP
jgi:undecaprenyl-diphosphatase